MSSHVQRANELSCWIKTNAGVGNSHRSQHETTGVYVAQCSFLDNFGVGDKGRPDVWKYPASKASVAHRMGIAPDLEGGALFISNRRNRI